MSHGLPDPPLEPPVNTSFLGLAPKFKLRLTALLDEDDDFMVAETVRTAERQAWLYGFGRSYDDGRGIVTNAPTHLTTWHGYGLAADIVSRSQAWNAPPSFFDKLGAAARQLGLSWGGDWPRFQDRPHVQHGAPMRQAPSQAAIDLFNSGGLVAVWTEVQAQ